MEEVTTIALDLAKLVFQAHGADGSGGVVFRKTLRRHKVLAFFAALPHCRTAALPHCRTAALPHCCIARRTAAVVRALPCRICPIASPSIDG
jgi:transposase